MRALFDQVLSLSLAGAWVIVFVLAARLPLRRAPARFRYLLWGLVLLRLLCPLTLESPASLLPERDPIHVNYVPAELEPAPTIAAPSPAAVDAEPDAHIETTPTPSPAQSAPAAAWSLRRTALRVLRAAWLPVAALLLAANLYSLLRLRRRLIGAAPLRDNILLADHIDTAFVLGVFRPRIYLPSGLPPEEREYILLHEQTHIRRRDPLWKLLGFLALCVHWFNPLVWLALRCAERDMELSCDEAVLSRLGPEIRQFYAASLLRLSAGRQTGVAFGEGGAKARIRNVLRYQHPRLLATLAGATAVILLACGLLTDPVKASALDGLTGVYEIEEVLGASPNAPETFEPTDFVLAENSLYVQEMNFASWFGSFFEMTLDDPALDALCADETLADLGLLKRENRRIWKATSGASVYLLLLQRDGSVCLIVSRVTLTEAPDPRVTQIFRLRRNGSPLPLLSGDYRAVEILYDAPEYSFTYTPGNLPVYSLSRGGDITVSGGVGKTDFTGPAAVELTERTFDDLFRIKDAEQTAALREIRERAEWEYIFFGFDSREFQYLFQIKEADGTRTLLLASGYTDESDAPSSIRWLFRLSRAPEEAPNPLPLDGLYSVTSILYSGAHLSTLPTIDTAPRYLIDYAPAEDGSLLPELSEQPYMESGASSRYPLTVALGDLYPIVPNEKNLDSRFPDGFHETLPLDQLRENAVGAWQLTDSGEYYQLLLQSNGQLYLIQGVTRDGEPLLASHVFQLTQVSNGASLREPLYEQAYETLLAFRVRDYESLPVSEFNRRLAPIELLGAERQELYALAAESLPADDPFADFFNVTLRASFSELYAEKFEETPFYSFSIIDRRRPYQPEDVQGVELLKQDLPAYHFEFHTTAYVSYEPDETVSVGTRDAALRELEAGLRAFVSAQSEETLRAPEIRDRLAEAAAQILAETPHDGMEISVEFSELTEAYTDLWGGNNRPDYAESVSP